MTIYILDNDLKKSAEYLDDRNLNIHICNAAQILCDDKPIYHRLSTLNSEMYKWSHEYKENYLWLIEYGLECSKEWMWRFNNIKLGINFHKHYIIIESARNTISNLRISLDGSRSGRRSQLPLLMPKKYQSPVYIGYGDDDIIESYRNYYQYKLQSKLNRIPACPNANIKWTGRQQPEWLKLEHTNA